MGGTVSIGMRYAPNNRRARSTRERRPAVKKIITVAKNRNEIFKQQQLTIGVDLGDRISRYCILDETGNVILEQSVPTTPKGIQQVFSKISRCRIALETGTHSPWVSRLLTQLGHEVIVAHARNVRLIGESTRKDDRLDARTLARLARIDPELLGPVRHRSAKAQIHLTVIRARATLVSARTALVNAARGLTKFLQSRSSICWWKLLPPLRLRVVSPRMSRRTHQRRPSVDHIHKNPWLVNDVLESAELAAEPPRVLGQLSAHLGK